MNIWDDMFEAASNVQKPRKVSDYIEAGGVAAAVVSESGKIYTGVCVDTCSGLGICAERAAIVAMLSAGEDRIALYVIENQIDAMYHRRIHLTKKENIKVYCDILRNKWGCKIPKSWRIKTMDDVYKYGETYCSGYPSPCSKH